MARIVAVDYGARRIGLAIGVPASGIAMPWRVLEGQNDCLADAATVWSALSDEPEQIERIVVGLPLNMDDTEGPQARRSRDFGQALKELSHLDVEFFDERLSSFEAKQRYIEAQGQGSRPGRRRKRGGKPTKPIDAIAAAVILEEYFRQR